MLENRFIDQADLRRRPSRSRTSPIAHEPPVEVDAPYFAEMVRLEAMERLGNNALTDGYVVKTTLDSTQQEAANQRAAQRSDHLRPAPRLSRRRSARRSRRATTQAELGQGAARLPLDRRARCPGIVTRVDATSAQRLSRRRPDASRSISPRSNGRARTSTKTAAARRRSASTTCSSAATSSACVARSERRKTKGDKLRSSTAEVAWMLRRCPRRTAFVRSIPKTARSRRWSAASASCAASSIASRSRTARRARASSRSSIPPRSSTASRRPRSSTMRRSCFRIRRSRMACGRRRTTTTRSRARSACAKRWSSR